MCVCVFGLMSESSIVPFEYLFVYMVRNSFDWLPQRRILFEDRLCREVAIMRDAYIIAFSSELDVANARC